MDEFVLADFDIRSSLHLAEFLQRKRMLAYKDGARVSLVSRNGRDRTRRFARLAAAVAALPARLLVLDGEVAIYDQKLRSRFDWLREPDPDAVATPPLLMAFDFLYQDGRELTGRPLRDRRARLDHATAGSNVVLPVRRLASNGFEAWPEVIARDYEGLVAKDKTSLYEAGPTRRWLKVKQRAGLSTKTTGSDASALLGKRPVGSATGASP